jgi:glycosyltransferase involved in cell wall biosynthesis
VSPKIVQIFSLPASEASGLWTAYKALCHTTRQIDPNALAIVHVPKHSEKHAEISFSGFPIEVSQHQDFLGFRKTAITAAQSAKALHFHGCWTSAGVLPLFVPKPVGAKFVHSTHGTLAPDAMMHRAWKKKPIWTLLQKPALNRADILHATSEKEATEIRAMKLKGQIVALDLPAYPMATRDPALPREKIVLFLGRLHPIKGTDLLIEAWAQVEQHFPDWRLVIAGPADYPGFKEQLESDVVKFGLRNVEFTGPIFGQEKFRMLQSASLVAVPSRSENFGYVVQEAIQAGTPVLTTTGTPWNNLERTGAGWTVEPNPRAIAQQLLIFLTSPPATLVTKIDTDLSRKYFGNSPTNAKPKYESLYQT